MLERYSHLSPPERCLAGNGSFVVAGAPGRRAEGLDGDNNPVRNYGRAPALAPSRSERALNGNSHTDGDVKVCRKGDSGGMRH